MYDSLHIVPPLSRALRAFPSFSPVAFSLLSPPISRNTLFVAVEARNTSAIILPPVVSVRSARNVRRWFR